MCTTRAVLPQHETYQSSGFIYNGHNGGISEDLPSKPRDIWIDYVATSLRDRWNDAEKKGILSRYLHGDVMGYRVGATS